MAAARYWRLVGIETYGYMADLELSELALYEGATRVDSSATLTSTFAPVSGALADLKDGDLATTARFLGAEVFSPGFSINWDFGAGVTADVSDLHIRAAASTLRFVHQFSLQSSSDSQTWLTVFIGLGLAYPGDGANFVISAGSDVEATTLLLHFNGANGSTSFIDSSLYPKAVTATGSAQISTAQSVFNGSSVYFNGASAISIAADDAFRFGSDNFAIDCRVRLTSLPPSGGFFTIAGIWISPLDFSWLFGIGNVSGVYYLYFYYSINGRDVLVAQSDAVTLTVGVWGHLEISRAGSAGLFFVEGVPSGTSMISGSIFSSASANLAVGGFSDLSGGFISAYMAEMRILKWVSGHTSAFTPAAQPYSSVSYLPPVGSVVLQPVATKRIGLAQASPDTINSQSIGITALTTDTPLVLSKDMQYGGRGKVVGTVKQKALPANTPLGRRVRLINERDNALVREGWSNPDTGAYEFLDIDPSLTYTVLSYDHLHNFRAVVADNLVPELMP